MKRPHDFLKGMFIAQAVIYVAYMVYGCFIYFYQGQYTFNPAYLGVSDYGWQTVGSYSSCHFPRRANSLQATPSPS